VEQQLEWIESDPPWETPSSGASRDKKTIKVQGFKGAVATTPTTSRSTTAMIRLLLLLHDLISRLLAAMASRRPPPAATP